MCYDLTVFAMAAKGGQVGQSARQAGHRQTSPSRKPPSARAERSCGAGAALTPASVGLGMTLSYRACCTPIESSRSVTALTAPHLDRPCGSGKGVRHLFGHQCLLEAAGRSGFHAGRRRVRCAVQHGRGVQERGTVWSVVQECGTAWGQACRTAWGCSTGMVCGVHAAWMPCGSVGACTPRYRLAGPAQGDSQQLLMSGGG